MSGQNPVGTYAVCNNTTQDYSTYKTNIDANSMVALRGAAAFAPHPASPAAMSVVIDAGFAESVTPAGWQNVAEVAQQTLAIAAAPGSPNNRIDLIVIDAASGAASVIEGTPASTPVAPAMPAGARQIAQVSVPNGTTAIAASNITDLRAIWGAFNRGVPFAVAAGTSEAITAAFAPATPTLGAAYDGYLWRVRAIAANTTTTPTFSPDGQGPYTVERQGAAILSASDIAGAGYEALLSFNWNGRSPFIELLNPAAPGGFTTGDVKTTLRAVADSGWVMMNDGSIGNAGSGATTRANADCQALFELLWNNIADTYCAVSGGRGASASADWSASKTIALPKVLGRALASAGAGAGLTSRALGQTVGEESHTLSIAEMPAHQHNYNQLESTLSGNLGWGTGSYATGTDDFTASAGGSGAHNNMQPTIFLNVIIKL